MKKRISLLLFLSLISPKYAISGYFPWGWAGWLPAVSDSSLLPGGSILQGSVVADYGNEELYMYVGSSWVEISGGGGGGVTAVTASSPLASSGGDTPNITCQTASGSQAGCLSSIDWMTFNSKQAALSFTSPLVDTSNTVTCNTASGSQAGCLSSSDWTTFNDKQAAGNYITALTGDGTASGPGSAALTLSTVNSDVGSYVCSDVTVNAKGLVTAAASGTSSDVIGLFSGCSGTDYLGADGSCHSAGSGSGTVSSGTTGEMAFYPSNGTTVNGSSGVTSDGTNLTVTSGKINATTANLSNLTASEIVETDASKNLVSAATVSTTLGGLGLNAGSSTGVVSMASGSTSIGTCAISNGCTGITTTPSDGTLLIGNSSSGYTSATLTAGTGIGITNASGSITITDTQNIPVTFAVNSSTTAGGTSTNLIYTNSVNDSASGYNATTGEYTIPAGDGGVWHFSVICYFGGSTAAVTINDNGTPFYQSGETTTGTLGPGSVEYPVSAGDVIAVYPTSNQTATSGALANQFSGFRVH